jgi:hypothetical protein
MYLCIIFTIKNVYIFTKILIKYVLWYICNNKISIMYSDHNLLSTCNLFNQLYYQWQKKLILIMTLCYKLCKYLNVNPNSEYPFCIRIQ